MKTFQHTFSNYFFLIIAGFIFHTSIIAQTSDLLQQSDFTYTGSFRLPGGNFGMPDGSFAFANGSVSGTVYNDPAHGKTVFVTGYLSAGYVSQTTSVAQVKIPALKDANTVGIDGLNTATVVQGFADPSNGIGAQALDVEGSVGIVCYSGKLIGTENNAYDAGCSQTKSAWVAPVNFSQASQATGPYSFNSTLSPRFLGGGYMTLIPQEWQTALGGKVVSGNGPWSIISCGSPGPALHVIDADLLISQPSASTLIPLTSLVYYEDGDHSYLGAWNSNSPDQIIDGKSIPNITVTDPHGRGTFTIAYEDNAMQVQGVLFAEGTSSVLFFGRKGLGAYCYGTGGTSGGVCYDPEDGDQGDHAYPYTEFVWAYDVNDMIAAKNGLIEPWEVLPYTGWIPVFPQDEVRGSAVGVAWDPETRLAYMFVEGGDGGINPIVHVFHVNDKVSQVEHTHKNGTVFSISALPNPFNPTVTISVNDNSLNTQKNTTLRVFDANGRFVADLSHSITNGQATWNAAAQPSGLYIVMATSGEKTMTKAITLIK